MKKDFKIYKNKILVCTLRISLSSKKIIFVYMNENYRNRSTLGYLKHQNKNLKISSYANPEIRTNEQYESLFIPGYDKKHDEKIFMKTI